MTGNAYTATDQTTADLTAELADRATWALNSLLEDGQDDLVADLTASYEADLAALRKAS